MASRYFAVAGVNIVTLKMNRTLSSAMVMTFVDIRIMIVEVSTSIQLVAVGSRMVGFTATNNAIRIGSTVHEPDLSTFQHYKNGFTIFRSGWGEHRDLKNESHTIIRHGDDLRRHSHNDRGSVHIYTAGRRWITDGGFHSYQQRNPNRIYTKSRLAHSLIDLPDQTHDVTGDVPVTYLEHTDAVHA